MKRLPTMKQLQYLVALADTRHFARAAERCHITQSTLSAGIRDLESVLGTPVAERSNRHVLMTRVGGEIAERAKALLRDAEGVMEVARAAREPMTGELRLGVIPTISPFYLPRVLPALRERFQDLTVFLREEQTAPLLARLEHGEIDAALIALPYDTGDLTAEAIFEDEFLLACPQDHPLAAATAVHPETLANENLLLLEEGHCLRGPRPRRLRPRRQAHPRPIRSQQPTNPHPNGRRRHRRNSRPPPRSKRRHPPRHQHRLVPPRDTSRPADRTWVAPNIPKGGRTPPAGKGVARTSRDGLMPLRGISLNRTARFGTGLVGAGLVPARAMRRRTRQGTGFLRPC